jgi:hypothetical protein
LYDRFKTGGQVPVSDTFQYLGMMVTQNRQRKSIAIDQIGYIKRILNHFEMTDLRKRMTPMEIGYKPHAIQANKEPFESGVYRKAIGSILYAALGTRHSAR